MTAYVAKVTVSLKPVVNDPQGLVVREGLHHLGFAGVQSVRVGKHLEVELEAESDSDAESQVTEMCEKLLRNPVLEDCEISVKAATRA